MSKSRSGAQTMEQLLRFRAAMDMSGDAIYLVDRTTMRFTDVNETACKRMGYTREELLSMGPQDLLTSTREELERMYDEVIAAGEAGITTETPARYRDGRRSDAELHRRALRSGDGWIIVSIARDITQRKRAERGSRQIGRLYAALSATNEAMLRAQLPGELYQQVCEAAVHGGKFISTSVLLPEPDEPVLRIAAVAGKGEQQLRGVRISVEGAMPEGRNLAGIAYRTREPCVSNDYLADERTRATHAMAEGAGVKAGAAIPILRGAETAGVLLIYADEKGAFDEEIVKLLVRMTENIAYALDNLEREERVRHLASHDGLTGLPNRAMFSQMLELAIGSARRYARRFAVLFIDLDGFKIVNDTLGHAAGDALLNQVSMRLRECLRSSDLVARLGGDEFVVLLQESKDADEVAGVARKILARVGEPADVGGHQCQVTASIGISLYPSDALDEQALMKSADSAMYLAKQAGRNGFRFFAPQERSAEQA